MPKTIDHPPISTNLLIRRPPKDLFEAFADPKFITKFWLSKSSGRLEKSKTIRWDFKIKGASAELEVKVLEPNKRIVIEWDEGVQVEWRFEERPEASTDITITLSHIKGDWSEAMAYAVDSMTGFTLVLCELKALLERNINLNLMHDKFPDLEYQ